METSALLNTLKKILKKKKVRYPELSQALGLSESGLKKMMTASDISIERLNKICQYLEISLADLIQLCQTEDIHKVDLTDAQNELLLKNSLALAVFWQMAIENKSIDVIQKNEHLSSLEIKKVLYKLEKVNLITTNLKGKISVVQKGLYRWNESSPVVQKINSEWSKITLEKALRNKHQKKIVSFHHLSYVLITEKNRTLILQKFSELMDEIARLHQISKFEKKRSDLVPLSLVCAAIGTGFFDRE